MLLRLAVEQTYRPLWSADILAETRRTMVESLGLSEQKADRRLAVMRENFIDAEITGYRDLIPVMKNNDKDKHVLAAAVRERAEVIVTFDLGGFPDDALKEYSIRALHPDDFLLDQLDLYQEATITAIRGMVDSWTNPPFTLDEILIALARRGAPNFAAEARLAFP
ncbi:PIN domain-containing protein [Mycobacterium kansasii]|nr:PIN domain-containing protein [Mycobacterium kansasii]ARG55080.1 PIN domain-containing protein [Mycobacterium kansasii]ARG60531.1 PIN domain-containing protein [Mycobacterium kansasii]ARG68214.1 PIN domain-containing protein [Mycobacterium kansasii]ARG77145.1 PIN domain-containing protein [Mycobacterium kansasii]ARG82676.1 PIN domain-containing protein [Mycobacterium kansasii]